MLLNLCSKIHCNIVKTQYSSILCNVLESVVVLFDERLCVTQTRIVDEDVFSKTHLLSLVVIHYHDFLRI